MAIQDAIDYAKERLNDPLRGRHLFMSLVTYEILQGQGELYWYILDCFLTVTDTFANKDFSLYLELETPDGKIIRTTALRKKLAVFKEHILSGNYSEIDFAIIDETKVRAGLNTRWLGYLRPVVIRTYRWEEMDVHGATFLEFGVTQWLAKLIGVERIQNLLIDCLQKTCQETEIVTGFITHDFFWPQGVVVTPHERYTDRAMNIHTSWLRGLLRGYFWGNLLSEKHVEALGGIDSIIKYAPCYKVSKVGEKNVFLQLTPSIFDFSDEALSKLKDYFKPILATKTKETDPMGYIGTRYIPDKAE